MHRRERLVREVYECSTEKRDLPDVIHLLRVELRVEDSTLPYRTNCMIYGYPKTSYLARTLHPPPKTAHRPYDCGTVQLSALLSLGEAAQ